MRTRKNLTDGSMNTPATLRNQRICSKIESPKHLILWKGRTRWVRV